MLKGKVVCLRRWKLRRKIGDGLRIGGAAGVKALLTATLCCFGTQAHAALSSITETVSVADQYADFSNVPVTFQQFDPSLGKLSSVEIILQGTGEMTQQYENTSNRAATKRVRQALSLSLFMPRGNQLLAVRQVEAHKYSVGSFDGEINFGGTSGESEAYDVTASKQKVMNSKSNLAMFTGVGLGELFLSAQSVFKVQNFDNNSIIEARALTGADITIIYNYIAVAIPEPVWFGALAGSTAFLVAWRSSTQKKRQS